MSVGDRIRAARLAAAMTQEELAQQLGYTDRSTIAKIESGENGVSFRTLNTFAEVLQVQPEWLAGWSDTAVTPNPDPAPAPGLKDEITLAVRKSWNPANLIGVVRITPEAEIELLNLSEKTGLSKREIASSLITQAAKIVKIVPDET